MSSSREGSPDWLRSYQAPTTTSLLSISSQSKSSPCDSPYREESEVVSSLPMMPDDTEATVEKESSESLSKRKSKAKTVTKQVSIEQLFSRKKKQNGKEVDNGETSSKDRGDDSVWLLSSDSDKDEDFVIKVKEEETTVKKTTKRKSPRKKTISNRTTPKEEHVVEETLKIEDTIIAEEVTKNKDIKDEDFVIHAKEAESSIKKATKKKSPKKKPISNNNEAPKEENIAEETVKSLDEVIAEEVTTNKNIKPSTSSSSRLPLVLSEKVNRTKVLVECEGDSIDLSGDMGAVGRVVVSDTTDDVYLDLKGTIYKSTIVPSRTFCIVNVSQSEAKIEAIMNDFIQLTPQSNVYESETMMEGTLEGFSYESDDEGNKNAKEPADQNGDAEGVAGTKGKGKAKAENVTGKKRARPSKEKKQPAKKARKSAPKKPKSKK